MAPFRESPPHPPRSGISCANGTGGVIQVKKKKGVGIPLAYAYIQAHEYLSLYQNVSREVIAESKGNGWKCLD